MKISFNLSRRVAKRSSSPFFLKRKLQLENLEQRLAMAVDLGANVCFAEPPIVVHQELKTMVPNSQDPKLELQIATSPEAPDRRGVPGSPPSPPVRQSGDVPAYQSLPSATKKIYLDFNGQLVTGSAWNNNVYFNGYNTGSVINAPPYSIDADVDNFSQEELNRIREIWARVAEDFAPFDVDVTTVDPGVAKFTAGGQGIRVVVSTDVDRTSGVQWFPPAGGVAYLNSWNFTSDTPVWVFANRLGGGFAKYVAEAASHEVGHSFNLRHDGRTSPSEEYYGGHGSGATGWSPIMGVGYYTPLSQFSRGEYANASQTEDDLAIINAALAYRPDEHGDTAATATLLNVDAAGALQASGVITRRTDLDAFRFTTQDGLIVLNFEPFERADGKANLDIEVKLYDSNGTLVTTVNPVDAINATISLTVSQGIYTVIVDGVGRVATTNHPGYSDYGSLGQYTLSGTVQPNRAPVAQADSASTSVGTSVLIPVLANDSDLDNDLLTIESPGTPSNGSVTVESGQIRYTPNAGFNGIDSFEYRINDGLGGLATALVQVEVVSAFANVEQVSLGNSAQRSMINQVTVPFSRIVTIQPGAFEVLKRGNDGGPVDVQVTTDIINGKTVATLAMSGAFVSGGSLVDGNYQLRVIANLITDGSQPILDGDGDGAVGGDFLFGATEADGFFRMFGDLDGNRQVTTSEFNEFRSAFGKSASSAGYRFEFDFDGNSNIGTSDFNAFRSRFGRRLQFS